MPSLVHVLKKYSCRVPRGVGDALALLPYSWRPGFAASYRNAAAARLWFDEKATPDEQRNFIFRRVRHMAQYAVQNVPFYARYYAESGFSVDSLRSFDDLTRIPVVSKEILQSTPLEERSCKRRGRTLTYTGGSTGEPFKFYSDALQVGNEWAHIHHIWKRLGYRQRDLLLSVALDEDREPVYYDALRHSIVLNIHYPRKTVVEAFQRIPLRKRRARYFRGYPSSLAELLSYCEEYEPGLLEELRQTIHGSFLASEFPLPSFRSAIERTTARPGISWYGHSERTLLAWEKTTPFLYEPMQSYGFCETVEDSDGFVSLVGTSYWNFASPLIRYRVNDGVRVVRKSDGILRAFEILEGRQGDYLIDRNGQKFSITHLNLSCRESTWAVARCIQVEQRRPGHAIIWVTPRQSVALEELESAFDFGRLNIDCEFRIVDRPFMTARGKVMLRVSTLPENDGVQKRPGN